MDCQGDPKEMEEYENLDVALDCDEYENIPAGVETDAFVECVIRENTSGSGSGSGSSSTGITARGHIPHDGIYVMIICLMIGLYFVL